MVHSKYNIFIIQTDYVPTLRLPSSIISKIEPNDQAPLRNSPGIMRTLPTMAADAASALALPRSLLLPPPLLPLLLLLLLLCHPASSQDTPPPSSYPPFAPFTYPPTYSAAFPTANGGGGGGGDGEGTEEVSGEVVVRTLEPTADSGSLTGRGAPSRIPTSPPSNDPTAKDFGLDVTVDIPGVDMGAAPPPAIMVRSPWRRILERQMHLAKLLRREGGGMRIPADDCRRESEGGAHHAPR